MSNDSKKTSQEPKPDMSAHYRPLGLKAVAAAAMMLKRKPKLTTAR